MYLIIHNIHRIFKSYARYWLTLVIHMCNQMFEKFSQDLNTFIIDTIVILLSWNTIAISRQLNAISVQRLIKYLYLNCTHKNSMVIESNLDLIKKFVELWKEPIHLQYIF
ncbi:unnamed protein product [Rotaria sordida]|uniref:Uncharacterized protein n=2 Tax=Rotaria sordida TaxID=392033 RepID=A0A814SZE8_9BILA|nr:unnamed protein product [Rotaria sordida]